ncbi:hypothetical protein ACNKHK_00755 [Shigella flexneri]
MLTGPVFAWRGWSRLCRSRLPAAIAKGEARSPLLTAKAIELLGTMQGGYNTHPLIDALDNAELAPIFKALSHTLLMFEITSMT